MNYFHYDEEGDYDEENDCYDYDPWSHMTNDPVDFYTYGYGGFGYDTSHVKPNEEHSALYHAAKAGNLSQVQELVSNETSMERKLELVNHARRWTEVDYKASGFTKEFEWYDCTPLMAAISGGHTEIVRYLLQEGADPELRACMNEDVYTTAEEEVQKLPDSHHTQKIKAMIETAKKYYSYENHKHAGYCSDKRTFELPEEMDKLLEELRVL